LEILSSQKILVIQTAFLGDAVLTLPMIQQLKLRNENSKISVLCIPSTKDLFGNSKAINEIIVYDKRKTDKSFSSFLRLIFKIRNTNFDLVYSPHRSMRSTLISFFSGAKETFGFDNAAFSKLYKHIIQYNSQHHEVARDLSLVGFDVEKNKWKIVPALEISENTTRKIESLVRSFGKKKFIGIAPGSVWKTKVYPEKYFIELIDILMRKGYYILLIGGKEDEILCGEITSKLNGNVSSVAGDLSILESIALLKKCEALICNDSAPTHLAMIAEIPVLTIYCSTIPAFGFYPYSSKSKFVSFDDLECKPCGIHGYNKCPVGTFDCGIKLTPQMIVEKLQKIIPV
jgi:heptosyltransferase II